MHKKRRTIAIHSCSCCTKQSQVERGREQKVLAVSRARYSEYLKVSITRGRDKWNNLMEGRRHDGLISAAVDTLPLGPQRQEVLLYRPAVVTRKSSLSSTPHAPRWELKAGLCDFMSTIVFITGTRRILHLFVHFSNVLVHKIIHKSNYTTNSSYLRSTASMVITSGHGQPQCSPMLCPR